MSSEAAAEEEKQQRPFRFSIDRGGTFTDVYAEVPGSKGFRVLKLLSEDPENYPDAPREGVRRILEVSQQGERQATVIFIRWYCCRSQVSIWGARGFFSCCACWLKLRHITMMRRELKE